MLKLYIIEYSSRGASWYWARSEEDAKSEARAIDQASEAELTEAEIWTIGEAVCKSDVIALFERYILKPLKK